MSKIVFFSIHAYGHTNPTLPVVKELINRGHEVWYYSFKEFKEKIENTGARFLECDKYLPPLSDKDAKKIGKDFTLLVNMSVDTTINMEKDNVGKRLKQFNPDCIVFDSVCTWGKLFAKKLDIPYVCSTTTFAFNQHTAKLMKQGFSEIFYMFTGMPKMIKKLHELKPLGYNVDKPQEIFANDNDTNTIVYTSKEFQPMADTFSNKYAFIGTSIFEPTEHLEKSTQKTIYISLGTVLNDNISFYKECILALKSSNLRVIMSVGQGTDISKLGDIPNEFTIKNRVNQVAVLEVADCFITHSGFNSVSESLYYGVPMVLYPQHSEELAITNRAVEMGTGVKLKGESANLIRDAVLKVLENQSYKENSERLSQSLKKSGGAKSGADFIELIINK
ncbi:MAG: macrolide family glycosyltransferase [Oscillospiraceae bacterium]